MTFLIRSFALFAIALAAPGAVAKGAPAKVTSVEGITEYSLDNGLHVLLFPDPSKATLTVNMTYRVGSRNEGYGETGMAHLLEHMLFKGSPKHRNIPQELTSHGARPNGSTWFDRTNYFETFRATDENLQWALDLEADRMVASYVAKKDLDTEMTVVRNEFEMGENDPSSILEERVLSTMFLWHNYGHSTIGARADIESVPIERLQAFYRTYYQPDNAVLLIAGKLDEAKTLALVQQKLGGIPRPARKLQATYTVEPTQDGERSVVLRRSGDVQVLSAGYHVPSGSHPDAGALDLLVQLLADTPSGRLHKALVETKKAASVSGYFMPLREPGFVILSATVRQDSSIDEARSALLAAIDELGKTPPTKEEIERARAKLLKEIELTLTNADRVGLQMSEWIGAGDWRLFFLQRDRTRSATQADVLRVAEAYFKPSNRTVGVFLPTAKPDRAEIPGVPDVAAMLKDYKGDAAAAQGEAFDASPANIEAKTLRSALPVGLKLALLPKKTRGGTVVAALTLHFGDEKSLFDKAVLADLATDMLLRGTPKHTRQQLQDAFDQAKARVSISGAPGTLIVAIETVREHLPETLALVAEALRTASFPESELELLRQENLAQIEQQRSEPQTMAPLAFRRHVNPFPKGDPRYLDLPEESIAQYKAAKLAEVKKFHADFFGASHGELAVAGDFDAAALAKQAGELFGDWKSAQPFARLALTSQAVPAENTVIEAPDKANAFFIAGETMALRDDDPDYPALALGNYMLGGGFLNSRLAVRIRQRDGLSYGVGSQLMASALDQYGSFLTYAICAPQNAPKVEVAFQEEVAKVLKDGFTAQEISEARSGFLQSRQVTRAQDGALAHTLGVYLYYGRTLAFDADLEQKIAALTNEQIVSALKKRLEPAKFTIVKVGDFAKGKIPVVVPK